MYKKPLKEIAEIFSGYLFKEILKNDENGDIKVIQLKNVNNDGDIKQKELFRVSLDNINERLFLKKDDIIFKSKSTNHTAAVIPEISGKIIVSSHFLILRVNEDSVIPEYLRWYLKQDFTMDYFKKKSGSRLVRLVNKKFLGEMEIKIPLVKNQMDIIELNDLFRKEKKLTKKIEEKKEEMLFSVILKLIEDEQQDRTDE